MSKITSFKSMASRLVLSESTLTEGREIEYYIEDKLLSVTLSANETEEMTFFLAGGDDEYDPASGEKAQAKKLLYHILKLLSNKGYFGDVGKFWSEASVKRKLESYGIMHVPLIQPIRHKQLAQIIKNAGLDVVSATKYDNEKESELDQEADPDELAKYKESVKKQVKNRGNDQDDDDMEEAFMSLGERMAYRKDRMQGLNERPNMSRTIRNQDKNLEEVGNMLADTYNIIENFALKNKMMNDNNMEMALNNLDKAIGILSEIGGFKINH